MAVCRTFTGVETRLQRPDGSVGLGNVSGRRPRLGGRTAACGGLSRGWPGRYRGASPGPSGCAKLQRAEWAFGSWPRSTGVSDGIASSATVTTSSTPTGRLPPCSADRRRISTVRGRHRHPGRGAGPKRGMGGRIPRSSGPMGASVDITVRLQPDFSTAWGQHLGPHGHARRRDRHSSAPRAGGGFWKQQLRSSRRSWRRWAGLAGGIATTFNNILAGISAYDTFLVDDLPEGHGAAPLLPSSIGPALPTRQGAGPQAVGVQPARRGRRPTGRLARLVRETAALCCERRCRPRSTFDRCRSPQAGDDQGQCDAAQPGADEPWASTPGTPSADRHGTIRSGRWKPWPPGDGRTRPLSSTGSAWA